MLSPEQVSFLGVWWRGPVPGQHSREASTITRERNELNLIEYFSLYYSFTQADDP